MSILNVEHLTHGFGDRAIFEDVSFRLLAGEHIGLVGANGEGKSTFMNIVTGKLMPDEGKVEWAKNVRTGYLDQNSTLQKGMTIESVLKSAFAWLFEQEERMNEICDQLGSADPDQMDAMMEELGVIQDMLTMHDFYVIDSKVEEVARALGLLELGLDHDVSDLSGGQRMKVLLAKLLLEKPDILLLDEPTNYLDAEHIAWLTRYLQEYENAFILISHDIPFLNDVVNIIYHMENQRLDRYVGNYDKFQEVYAVKKSQLEAAYRKQQQEISELKDFVARNKARVATRNMAMSRQKKLDKMENLNLEPRKVFDCFALVNKVPRPSKKEEKMIAFLKEYGESLGLETNVDEVGNVIIKKPASKGYESCATTIIQSHMDMVCEKNADVDFDFMNDAIQTEIDGEWMRAKGTTLGADDGIGVAMELALLADDTIEHGPIECVFTRDEETGLTGAQGMKPGFMSGKYLLNLDSEDEGQIFVSCAGGARTEVTFNFNCEQAPENYFFFKVGVKGLTGGHSGDDINKKRANANKLLVRFMYNEMKKYGLRVSDIQSGGLHNAIPREGWAVCAVPVEYKENVRVDLNVFASEVEEEYSQTEKSVQFTLESVEPSEVIEKNISDKIITALQAVYNGVFAMSQDLDWLVETSSNLASIHKVGNKVLINSSQRSSLGSARRNMSDTFAATFELAGAEVKIGEGYPGWKMNPDSEILKITQEAYKRLFNKDCKVLAIHAGLECGLFSEKYPGLDMVSFGPTLRGVHSPDEKLLIPTVKMVWDLLLEILKNIPKVK